MTEFLEDSGAGEDLKRGYIIKDWHYVLYPCGQKGTENTKLYKWKH